MTQLYLEQVLIGGMGLFILALPWLPELLAMAGASKEASSLATGSLAAGAAFLLGIPLDRIADTLTERLERHGRLIFGLTRLCSDRRRDQSTALDVSQDVFPEHRYHAVGLRAPEAVVKWLGYHRSRLRLTRALAVYGPALSFMGTIGTLRWTAPTRDAVTPAAPLAALAVLYVTWAVLLRWRSQKSRSRASRDLPKTHQSTDVTTYATQWGFVDGDGRPRDAKDGGPDFAVWRSEWVCWLVPVTVSLMAVAVAAFAGPHPGALVVSVTGAMLTVLSAWSWWRIGFTYRTYLADLADGQRPD